MATLISAAPLSATPAIAGPTADEIALSLRDLTKRFSTRTSLRDVFRGRPRVINTVVDQVSFDVNVGEIVGVLGPNGAGKTTIFKMLSTVVLPDDGTATVFGKDIWLQPGRVRAALAAVSPDERSLNWRLSARENLLLFAALYGIARHEADAIVSSVLQTVGLVATGRKMVAAFSSGMRQRLLIARALLANPKVLLLDEPTRALDPLSAEEFRQFLRRDLVGCRGCTVVLATHNADEALGLCDRVVVLNQGRVLAVGSASDLKSRYGEERYRILTSDPHHPSFARLNTIGMLRALTKPGRSPDGWFTLECAIPGDPSRTANVLQLLVNSGVTVARLERIDPSLADLIGRIIGASSTEYPRA